MNDLNGLNFGLGSLPLMSDARTRSISAENPTGEKGKGGMAIPNPEDPDLPHSGPAVDLGQGWKVRPFLVAQPGETVTLMDVDGPGIIQHIWITTATDYAGKGRACILRFYWDDEETPSIEAPLTDFFALGHEQFARVNSLAVIVNPLSAMNCYWPMPFRKHCRVTLTNDSDVLIDPVAYQITYAETDVPDNAAYFHAQWRRAVTDPENPDYTIVDGIKGKGHYAGTFLAWTQFNDGWFGEGEIKFYMDGDTDFPTICGTGTEDYFCGSYGFPESYTTAYVGTTIASSDAKAPARWSLYRWHIMDPIRFEEDLRITIQALGWLPTWKFRALADDIASVAYWYQAEPHAEFPAFPPLEDRRPLQQDTEQA